MPGRGGRYGGCAGGRLEAHTQTARRRRRRRGARRRARSAHTGASWPPRQRSPTSSALSTCHTRTERRPRRCRRFDEEQRHVAEVPGEEGAASAAVHRSRSGHGGEGRPGAKERHWRCAHGSTRGTSTCGLHAARRRPASAEHSCRHARAAAAHARGPAQHEGPALRFGGRAGVGAVGRAARGAVGADLAKRGGGRRRARRRARRRCRRRRQPSPFLLAYPRP